MSQVRYQHVPSMLSGKESRHWICQGKRTFPRSLYRNGLAVRTSGWKDMARGYG